MKSYRNAFLITLIVAVLLAGGLGYVAWRAHWRIPGKAGKPSAAKPVLTAGTTNKEAAPAPPTAPPLAPVEITPQRLQEIGVKTGVVESKPVYNDIRAPGNVEIDEQLESDIQLRFTGWIQQVFANYTYQRIRKGQPLFTIYSPDLVTTEQEYLIAQKNQQLLAASTVPGVASGAFSLLDAAAERLRQWQIPAGEIARLKTARTVRHEIEIDSPVSGYITERNVLPHMYVQPGTKLYTVTNLSTVWIYANIFQDQIGQVKTGDAAVITTGAYPGRTFHGHVDFIWPQVDAATRTVKVRLAFPNPSLKLTPGMFVNVSLKAPLGRHLVIPASGIFQTGTRNIAFVDHGGGYLEPRDVELGPRAGDEFIVLKGLKAGERIVTSANFLIDSESQLQAAIGSFVPPPPGAGAAAAMNTSAQAEISFTTSPSPPHKGNNTFRVRLTGSDGRPVSGAKVTVTFFMPAMPAMGMSAMRVMVTLSDKGGGMYEGTGNLGSGGTWQVSIAANKNGQTIAAKQLTVSAGGGM